MLEIWMASFSDWFSTITAAFANWDYQHLVMLKLLWT